MSASWLSSPDVIDATDININAGSGGLGLGAPSFTGFPAPGTDIAAGGTVGQRGTPASPQLGGSTPGLTMESLTGVAGANSWNTNAPGNAYGTAQQAMAGLGQGGASFPAVAGLASAWYVRTIVVVLGVVFVAAGLHLLAGGATISVVPARR